MSTISFAVNALQQKMQGTQSVLSCCFQCHPHFCDMKNRHKRFIFPHEMPVFSVFFTIPIPNLRQNLPVYAGISRLKPVFVCVKKYQILKMKPHFTPQIPERKPQKNRKQVTKPYGYGTYSCDSSPNMLKFSQRNI